MQKLMTPLLLSIFVLFIAFLDNPLSAKEVKWKCVADGLENFEFDGGNTAYIHLESYNSGNNYYVEFNASKTVATGKTGDGTPFTCSIVQE